MCRWKQLKGKVTGSYQVDWSYCATAHYEKRNHWWIEWFILCSYAESVGAKHFETSAKNNVGVEELFLELTNMVTLCIRTFIFHLRLETKTNIFVRAPIRWLHHMMPNKRNIQTVGRIRWDAVIDWWLLIVVIWKIGLRQDVVVMAKWQFVSMWTGLYDWRYKINFIEEMFNERNDMKWSNEI